MSTLPPAPLFEALRADAKHFGPLLAERAYTRGLAVTNRADGTTKPIPITATPVIVTKAELDRRLQLSALLSSAAAKMAHAVLKGPAKAMLLDGMSPLERAMAEATFERARTLVTTRVDFFVGKKVEALEVNATIPAMQGYSDIAAHTLIEIVGKHWGANAELIAKWQAQNGSNALALYRALLNGYAQVRPGQQPRSIALLSRRNDAQLTEQRYLCERFRDFGADADVVHPDQLEGQDAVRANGKAYDLVYRHLFVRRLEEPDMAGAAYVVDLLKEPQGRRAVVLNPPASQVEAKLVFALMSQSLEDPGLAGEAGLTPQELDAIAQSVPWTRPFHDDAIVKKVTADPDRYVLKRSWDYGGRAVFVGRTRNEASYEERVKAAYGSALDWGELCKRALADRAGGGFIVQELVETSPEAHVLCSGTQQTDAQLYVDFSAYASVGLQGSAWGGVCRGSLSHIVNIVGGGGVIPLLTDEVAGALTNVYGVHISRIKGDLIMAWETPGAVSGDMGNSQILAEESAKTFMARVYRWMGAGLALTGLTAWVVAASPPLLEVVMPLWLPLIIGEFVMVLAFSWLAPRASTPVAAAMFLAYAFMNGLTFSVLFLVYTQGSIAATFGITAAMFGAMSVYGSVTKKDLASWGGFLMMGLVGIIVAGIVNVFLQSPAMYFVISCVGVLLFTALAAYDTQKLRQMHASSGYASTGTLAINGALILYLDFVNLMVYLLRLFGRRR